MGFFEAGLAMALTIGVAGLAWRKWGWLTFRLQTLPGGSRFFAHLDRILTRRALARVPAVIGALVLDALLLRRVWRNTTHWRAARWAGHMALFYGFLGLTVFHAMDGVVTRPLFTASEPVQDPWQLLRDALGLVALAGLLLLAARRVLDERLRALTRAQDWALLLLVGTILASGVALESAKLLSPRVFQRMLTDYAFIDDPDDLRALRAWWVADQGAWLPGVDAPAQGLVARGAEVNADNCAVCHSDTASAVAARPLAALLRPVAPRMALSNAQAFLWYLHLGACFLALALLPWGKFVHVFLTPVNLARRGLRPGSDLPAKSRGELGPAEALAQAMGMDACTRCGECSLRCSVRPIHTVLGTAEILPSEKLLAQRAHLRGAPLTGRALEAFSEGSRICTECLRCTLVCPAGIDLQALWLAGKRGLAGPGEVLRTLAPDTLADVLGRAAPDNPPSAAEREQGDGLADRPRSFRGCVQCTTCTSVCPVVAVSDDPTRDLDLTPQQIMNMLRMGLKDETLPARMVWSCTTCYKCQEHCPQGVPVADILFELRNVAAQRLREARGRQEVRP